ncbi:Sec-independent protein translocase protein TatA [Staphylococcus saprophyticus]|uniref:hypothetical protein n=1 Tax=Staphylococcus TaxID=1279 RepID=UPI000660E6EC|nr:MULTISPECIES: hypothetical protein [Staphylococcus]MDH9184686.1 hypothetical protein [Staphylococcus epidermidis]QHD15661.1 hypothetical protein FNY53_02590 [Staphylococcus equorum]AMG33038.1 hypothetical protein AL494_04375 [Staphylococcus saprophyticus]ASE58973.1 hypothetical protein CEQ14_07245 [Staphylococcus saprophyticus]MBN6756536.1 hypothetical protein [Staphylococcus saprophyticus]
MSNLEPVPHKTLLNRIYPNGDIPVNFMNDTKNQKDDIMELNKNDESGGGDMNNYVTRDEFNNGIKEFKDEMRAMRTDMNNNMNSIRTDMNNNMNSLRTEMNTNSNYLRSEMQNSISKLPTNSEVENILLKNNKELDKEAKQNRNTIIGWTIGIVGLGFTIAKSLGWL